MPHFTLDISTTCMKIRLLLLGMGLLSTSVLQAQMTGVVVEVDTAFYGPNTPTPEDTFDPAGLLDGFVTYKIYAEFMSASDVLSSIYADVDALGTSPMYIDAPCGCHNPVFGSMAMDGTNPSCVAHGSATSHLIPHGRDPSVNVALENSFAYSLILPLRLFFMNFLN